MTVVDIKAKVRERDGKCVDCGITSDEHRRFCGEELSVHRLIPGSAYSVGGCETVCRACHNHRHIRISENSKNHAIMDCNGRHVRLRHCIVVKDFGVAGKPERILWAHVDDADLSFLYQAFHQRQMQIRADVRALFADLNYTNQRLRERGKREIQLDLDNLASDEENPEEAA